MGFSFGVILRELQNDTTIRTNLDTENDYPVSGFEVWSAGLPDKEICYLLSSEQFLADPSIWRHRTVICSGWLDDIALHESKAYLACVSPQLTVPELHRLVQKAFYKYYQWIISLQHLLCRKQPIQSVLTLTEEQYGIYSCISTESMQIVGASESYSKLNPWLSNENTVSLTLVNDLASDQDFNDASTVKGAFLYYDLQQDWYYCYNFISEGTYDARMICCAEDHMKNYGMMALVSSLGDCISDVYEDYLYDRFHMAMQKELEDIILKQLRGVIASEGEIRKILSSFKWENKQNFQVILFQFLPGAGGQVGVSFYPSQIQKLFRDSHVISMDDRFICIRNVSDTATSTDEYLEKLPYYLRETLSKAGISNIFHDFHHLYHHYLEAESALILGNRLDSTLWYYSFSNYTVPYILEQSTKDLQPIQLYHPAVIRLQKYDNDNGTQLVKTLDTFMQHKQNITHAAEELQIHRTSLLARLDRIRQLTAVNLDDPDTIFHLMFTFALIRRPS